MEAFALCPVHDGRTEPIHVWTVPPGQVAIAGRAEAVRDWLDVDLEDNQYIIARNELPLGHPMQMLVVPAIAGDFAPEEFMPSGDGAFSLPAGYVIERNPYGEICVHVPGTSRHTAIAPFPVQNLN